MGKPEIKELNHLVDNPDIEMKRLTEAAIKQHKEMINGYDKQLEECLQDLARFSTKMLLMFEDYLKKGDVESCVKLLQSMNNYALMTGTTARIVSRTNEMLIDKLRNSGGD